MNASERPRAAGWLRCLGLATAVAVAIGITLPARPARAESASKVRAQMNALESEMREAGRDFDRAWWALDESLVRERKIEKRLEGTRKEIRKARRLLGARVEAMYRSGGPGIVAVLLASEDFGDLVTRVEFFQRIGSADADAIESVRKLNARLIRDKKRLNMETKAKRDAARRLQRERDRMQARFRAKQSEYKRLQARLSAAAKASSGGSYVPAGPNGMVFPVRGPHYYSDTWGASRSGGRRRHKGTDIMAATGTPCVAVLSGSVSARSNGLGGLCIWLRADNGWTFYYAHLSGYAVTSGRVSAGQTVGYVGSTGNARGGSPHLHFEIHPGGGAAVNPYPYLRAMQ